MVLVNAISVIMKQYTISYTEVCYEVNRFSIQFSVLYRPNFSQIPNRALNIYPMC